MIVLDLSAVDELHLARALALYQRRIRADGIRLPGGLSALLDALSDRERHTTTDREDAAEPAHSDAMSPLVLFEIGEIAARLRVSTRTVERLIEAGTLPAVKVSPRETRVRPSDLERYIETLEPVKGAA